MIYSLDQIDRVARKIIDDLEEHKVICVNGDMGVGKTTLIKKIGEFLGVSDAIHSPTFAIVNEYHCNDNTPMYHFDFYRIENEFEALDIGVEDYMSNNNWCFLEWAEKIPNLIPSNINYINFKLSDGNNRTIEIDLNE